MKRYLLGLCVLILSGCMTMGKEVSEEQLAGFKKGETTISQVIAKLGSPTSSSVSATGERNISYSFAHAQARPESFIPYIGPFVGGADSRSSLVVFVFGTDGKLLNYYATHSLLGTGKNFAAGQYQQRTPDQPQESTPRGRPTDQQAATSSPVVIQPVAPQPAPLPAPTQSVAVQPAPPPPAATQPAPTPRTHAATPAPTPSTPLEQKLRELKRLSDAGLLSQEIYVERQRKLLEDTPTPAAAEGQSPRNIVIPNPLYR